MSHHKPDWSRKCHLNATSISWSQAIQIALDAFSQHPLLRFHILRSYNSTTWFTLSDHSYRSLPSSDPAFSATFVFSGTIVMLRQAAALIPKGFFDA